MSNDYIKVKRADLEKLLDIATNGSDSEKSLIAKHGDYAKYPYRLGTLQSMVEIILKRG